VNRFLRGPYPLPFRTKTSSERESNLVQFRRTLGFSALVFSAAASLASAGGVLVSRDGSPPIAVRSHRITTIAKMTMAMKTYYRYDNLFLAR